MWLDINGFRSSKSQDTFICPISGRNLRQQIHLFIFHVAIPIVTC